MYHFIYQTKNIINNKTYIGVHSTPNLNDGYIGCGCHKNSIRNTNTGSILPKAIKKYGVKSFIMIPIIFFKNREDAYRMEEFFVDERWTQRKDNYNIAVGGCGGYRYDMSGKNNPNYGKTTPKSVREKISKSVIEAHKRGDFIGVDFNNSGAIEKMTAANRGRKMSDKLKKEAAERMKGNTHAKKRSVKIKGVIYESIAEASKQTGISTTHIARIDEFSK